MGTPTGMRDEREKDNFFGAAVVSASAAGVVSGVIGHLYNFLARQDAAGYHLERVEATC